MLAIPRTDWVGFCKSFTLSHSGWLVTVDVASAGHHQTIAEEEPLKAVSAEFEEVEDDAKILISIGREPLERTFQTVKQAIAVSLDEARAGEHRGLRVISKDGSVTTVSLRAPAKPS
ncbi:MAG TPA: hypothetical protein VLF14_03065 [Candidatus Binatia bacterium]|nr:hypothetical protein [Candidatus Binatia bacterium]